MGELKQFRLPDVGEGLTEAEILTWLVAPGDTVTVNQIIVEIETAKAAVELPSPFAGTVAELHVEQGATVDVGTPIITIDVPVAAGAAGSAPAAGAASTAPAAPAAPQAAGEAGEKREPVLVGYGVRQGASTRRARRVAPTGPAAAPPPAEPGGYYAPPPAEPEPPAAPEPARTRGGAGTGPGRGAKVLAKPPVRKLAKDLGIDLGLIAPTGANGVITRADVEAARGSASAPAVVPVAPAAPVVRPGAGDVRIPIKGVRKATAAAMVTSAFTAPHVTEFLTIDVTPTMELVGRLRERPEFAGVKVSPLLLVAKALLLACKRHPEINATWDEPNQEIVIREHVNLGIAAATPRGLIVPNIKAAETLGLPELAAALGSLTAVARDGKTSPADLTGGTITITNVGVFGVDTGTPILNPGEAAILAFGAVREQAWVVRGKHGKSKLKPRQVTTLGLSFDHRLVDGELGSKFLRDVGAVLEDPSLALLFN